MTLHLSESTHAKLWLTQFKGAEESLARALLDKFVLISSRKFASELTAEAERIAPGEKVAFFVEREIPRHWVKIKPLQKFSYPAQGTNQRVTVSALPSKKKKLVPRGMYKEVLLPRGKGLPKRCRAEGEALPAVSSIRRDQQSIGSEGIVATAISKVCEANNARFCLHPSTNHVRKFRVRHFVVVTDFIGSGTRVTSMLDSLWRVRSVRSWFSGKRIKLSVLAYTGTSIGINHVNRHPSKPKIILVHPCPTIDNSFSGQLRNDIRALCISRSPDKVEPLGYKSVGALLAFEHSCPNNVPAIFFKGNGSRRNPWHPLFPKRNTLEVSRNSHQMDLRYRERLALETLKFNEIANSPAYVRTSVDKRMAIILTATLARGHRTLDAIATITALSTTSISKGIELATELGLLDKNNRPTAQGFALLKRLNTKKKKPTVANMDKKPYYPISLRAPL